MLSKNESFWQIYADCSSVLFWLLVSNVPFKITVPVRPSGAAMLWPFCKNESVDATDGLIRFCEVSIFGFVSCNLDVLFLILIPLNDIKI